MRERNRNIFASFLVALLISLELTAVSSQLIVPAFVEARPQLYRPLGGRRPRKVDLGQVNSLSHQHDPVENQQPIILDTMTSHPNEGPVLLSDVLPIDRAINIFSGFTRSVDSAHKRLEDPQQNTTVLAPANSAITKLPRKPWESPDDEEDAGGAHLVAKLYEGLSGEDRAARNLRRFVEAHLVAQSPWEKGEQNKAKTLEGKEVWWDEVDGQKRIYPDNILVKTKEDEVSNGQVWVLEGVINY
ncbi:hypothetical protein BJ508DRAFT_414801 [Ascobolus immersus RN42]|uniref:FAS1 domain-containing protein n=1 Tax=Ascobolus immersus RN42 TaxID=1160509 RepID=A0A3N4I5J9_ASCIM|nr:hypothetical protein BJ508DRAFT_414801 [Ascobolus immersus RN42]